MSETNVSAGDWGRVVSALSELKAVIACYMPDTQAYGRCAAKLDELEQLLRIGPGRPQS